MRAVKKNKKKKPPFLGKMPVLRHYTSQILNRHCLLEQRKGASCGAAGSGVTADGAAVVSQGIFFDAAIRGT